MAGARVGRHNKKAANKGGFFIDPRTCAGERIGLIKASDEDVIDRRPPTRVVKNFPVVEFVRNVKSV
jgi:hypothetical protein